MSDTAERTGKPPPAALAVGALAVLGVLGAFFMTLSHLGLDIRIIGDLGAGRLIMPVAISFAMGTVLYVIVAVGAFSVRRWAWPVGLLVNLLAFLGSAFPFRGWVSAVAIVVSLTAIGVLVSPPGRRAFLHRH